MVFAQLLQILTVTVPVYLLIGLGYAAARRGSYPRPDTRVLGRFVIQLALPALVFQALAQRPFAEIVNPVYLAAYGLGSLAVMLGVWFCARRMPQHRGAFAAVFAMGTSVSNSGFVGYPIVAQLMGPTAVVAMALCMIIENVLIIPLGLGLAELQPVSRAWTSAMRQTARRLLANPLIIAIAAGMAVSMTGLVLPAPLMKAVGLLANASSALALFVIGSSLAGLKLQGRLREVAAVALSKLALHPLAVLLLALLLPLDGPLRTAAVAYAAMPMMSIFPILAQPYGEETFAAAALLSATVLSFVTLTAWLWLLTHVLGWPLG